MKIILNGSIITEDARVASSFKDRLTGLSGRKGIEPGFCMIFRDCGFIHGFFMKEKIDVAMTDGKGRVVLVVAGMKPWTLAGSFAARHTYEFGSGAAGKFGIKTGDTLTAR